MVQIITTFNQNLKFARRKSENVNTFTQTFVNVRKQYFVYT
uniref:Uncharacterized protein n=1 Tax=Myoviridae sp. ctlRg1 TaxID=2826692 RepID=A0A8S5M654_9CAUD|nr:MAG TPA: hypothetical protein [Myoviridae sp. ctlRg1]DAK39181.1 MAG TPA: hypothetical protein [Caudoviricetes sp.]